MEEDHLCSPGPMQEKSAKVDLDVVVCIVSVDQGSTSSVPMVRLKFRNRFGILIERRVSARVLTQARTWPQHETGHGTGPGSGRLSVFPPRTQHTKQQESCPAEPFGHDSDTCLWSVLILH